MANYANLKAQIDANIYQNDQSAITGAVMNAQLKAMIDALGAGYQFMGVATPTTNPGTPDERVFYIANTRGTYTNFGGITVGRKTIALLVHNGTSWVKVNTNIQNAMYLLGSFYNITQIMGSAYANLAAALEAGANNDAISQGTTIKFARSYSSARGYYNWQIWTLGDGFTTDEGWKDTTKWSLLYDSETDVYAPASLVQRVTDAEEAISTNNGEIDDLKEDVIVPTPEYISTTSILNGRYANQSTGAIVAYTAGEWNVAIFPVTVGHKIALHIPKSGNSLCGSIMWGSSASQTSGLVREGGIVGDESEQNFTNIVVKDAFLFCTYNKTVSNPIPVLTDLLTEKVNVVAEQNMDDIVNIKAKNEQQDTRIEALEGEIITPRLAVVSKYYLNAGELFELFFNGIFTGINAEDYDFIVKFSDNVFRGNHYTEKWQWTPAVADVGTYTVTIDVYSNTAKIDTKTVTLQVKNPANLTTSGKVCLFIGDSLMLGNDNAIVGEVYRRICSSDAASEADNVVYPAGYGKNNFTFIGINQSSRQPNAWSVGVGGWTADFYNKESLRRDWQWLTCTHDKTSADQHSTYKDSSNRVWRIETIESGMLKVYEISGAYPSAALSGTLTWVSGGENHSDIVISSAAYAPGNPFWFNNEVDFYAFAQSVGVSAIDYVVIELGTNNMDTDDETLISDTKTLIDNILADFPNCKICLMTTHKSARDGWSGYATTYHEWLLFCAHLKEVYQTIAADYSGKVTVCDMAAQLDTDHCTTWSYLYFNSRYRGTGVPYRRVCLNNAVHPNYAGDLMIADAIVRDMIFRFA